MIKPILKTTKPVKTPTTGLIFFYSPDKVRTFSSDVKIHKIPRKKYLSLALQKNVLSSQSKSGENMKLSTALVVIYNLTYNSINTQFLGEHEAPAIFIPCDKCEA